MRYYLGGAFGGFTRTLGAVDVKEEDLQGILLKLHVVEDNTALPADGILGRDNIWNRTIINTKEKQLIFYDEGNQEVLKCPLININRINQFKSSPINNIENNIVKARTLIFTGLMVRALTILNTKEKQLIFYLY